MTKRTNPATCEICGGLLSPDGLCAPCLLGGAKESNQPAQIKNSASLLRQREFAGYTLIDEIARGGMGTVFRARQLQPDREVALKVISSGELASPRVVERFRVESAAAAKLQHPGIVPVYEVGCEDGWNFFTMRLIEGHTLADEIAGKPMEPRRAVELMIKVADAVSHAHAHGLLHRDLKPTNILIDAEGEPFLTDFGLARALEDESGLTLTNIAVGTPAYMAPEQAMAQSGEVATTSDVYGLGAILFEMLTGRPPFTAGSVPEVLRKVAEEEAAFPPDFRQKRDHADLEVICLRCLEKERERRYASASEFADDLGRWLRHEPIVARASGTWDRYRKWVRRRPDLAALSAGLIALVVALLVVLIGYNISLGKARDDAQASEVQSRKALIDSHLREASRRFAVNDGFLGITAIAQARNLADDNPKLAEEIDQRLAIASRFAPKLVRVWDAEESPREVAFSKDGERLLTRLDDGSTRVWSLENDRRILAPAAAERTPNASFLDPHGIWVLELFDEEPFARAWNSASGEVREFDLDSSCNGVGGVAPGGRRFAFGGESLRVWTEEIPGSIRKFEGKRAPACNWSGFSPDGETLFSAHVNELGWFWDVASGERLNMATMDLSVDTLGLFSDQRPPRFSDNGEIVVYARHSELRSRHVRSGVLFAQHPCNTLIDYDLSKSGQFLGTAEFGKQAAIWKRYSSNPNAAWVRLEPNLPHESGANRIRFSPNGNWVATAGLDFRVKIWNPQLRQIAPDIHHTGLVFGLDFSEDQRLLATGDVNGLIRIWDLENLAEQTPIREGVIQHNANFSADSRFLPIIINQNSVGLWEVEKRQVSKTFDAGREIFSAMFSPNQQLLAACGPGGAVVWELKSGERVFDIKNGFVPDLAFSPDSALLAIGDESGLTNLIDLSNPTDEPKPIGGPGDVRSYAIEWSPDGRWVGSMGGIRTLIWDRVEARETDISIPNATTATSMNFRSDSRQLLVSSQSYEVIESSNVFVYDLPSLTIFPLPIRHSDGVSQAKFSPDSRLIATAGEDNVARIWDAQTGRQLVPNFRHSEIVKSVAFHPDGRVLATVATDGVLKLWNVDDGELLAIPIDAGYGFFPRQIRFSPDGRWLLVRSTNDHPLIIDLNTEPAEARAAMHQSKFASGMRLKPDGGFMPMTVKEQAESFEEVYAENP